MSKVIAFRLNEKDLALLGNPSSLEIKQMVVGNLEIPNYHKIESMLLEIQEQIASINSKI